MYTNSILAVSGALIAAVAAVPMAEPHHHHHKRDYVWVTHSEVVIETVAVTKTVWVEPGETPEVMPVENNTPAEKTPVAYPPPAAYSPPVENKPSTPQGYVAPTTAPAPPAYVAPSSSSSVNVAPPAPTTPSSTYVAPAPPAPSTYEAPPPPAPAAPAPAASSAAASSGGGSGMSSGMAASGKTYTGDLTWYEVGLGACGETSTKDEAVVAIPEKIFDSYSTGNPNTNPLCGKTVSITGKDGQQHKATVVDRCPGCTENDLDLSEDFFNKVTEHGDGRVGGMEWSFD